ncbi:MAG: hypothetical protein JWM73_1969, partial [Solirubrobacterales bacterium]|nr:hypothetical protein [Solirubrobacterales bacterium]
GGGARRALMVLVILALIGAGVAIAISQSGGGSTPKITGTDQPATGNDARETVSKLQSLIDQNTR